jgi:hypothetical protein
VAITITSLMNPCATTGQDRRGRTRSMVRALAQRHEWRRCFRHRIDSFSNPWSLQTQQFRYLALPLARLMVAKAVAELRWCVLWARVDTRVSKRRAQETQSDLNCEQLKLRALGLIVPDIVRNSGQCSVVLTKNSSDHTVCQTVITLVSNCK